MSLSINVSSVEVCKTVVESLKELLPIRVIDSNNTRDHSCRETTGYDSHISCSQMAFSQEVNADELSSSNPSDQLFKPSVDQQQTDSVQLVTGTDVSNGLENERGQNKSGRCHESNERGCDDRGRGQHPAKGQRQDDDNVITIDQIAQVSHSQLIE